MKGVEGGGHGNMCTCRVVKIMKRVRGRVGFVWGGVERDGS